MKKIVVILLCLMMFCGIGLYLTSEVILTKLSNKALDYLSANIKTQNFKYTRPTFSRVVLSSWNAVTWSDIAANASLVRNDEDKTENITLNIGSMTISIEDFFSPTLFFRADQLSTTTTETGNKIDSSEVPVRIEDGQLEMLFNLNGFSKADILEQIRTVKDEMRRFSKSGVTKLPIYFSATGKFEIQGQPCVAKFSMLQEGEKYRLVMDKNDLQNIVALLSGPKPNPVEIDIIAHNPLKAATLIKIRDKARTTAKLAAHKNSNVPEDAYRHTLWSYLLTKRYGEQFAKQVTDAHEAYADEEELSKSVDFSEASYQDLVNNAQGRKYAELHYKEADILEKVMTDPAIIKDNEVQNRFDMLEYESLKPVIHGGSLFPSDL